MPDDAPEKCVGPEAEAVARYIYDAFYSREARIRNHPPRVELVRLTNRQYLNTVADLIRHFTGSDGVVAGERGLRASYYSSRNFNRESKIFERVDRQVSFDFGEGNPDQVPVGTNGFSMQWRGSLIADETGEYEFLLKTPNGARLWVNDEEQTLIDAWVASGEANEHKDAAPDRWARVSAATGLLQVQGEDRCDLFAMETAARHPGTRSRPQPFNRKCDPNDGDHHAVPAG